MKIKKQMILRSVADENVLVPVGESAGEFKGMFMLTETAAYMYSLLEQADSAEFLAEKTAEKYDGDYNEILADAQEFLEKLRGFGII